MIEFVLKNRKLRLHPDGVIYARAHQKGVETKNGKWKEVKFCYKDGYVVCGIRLDGIHTLMRKHRMVWYAHHQDWDIWDTSKDNVIDHINRKKDDNRIDNLHIATQQENTFNTDAKGYSWHKARGKWKARIIVNGEQKYLGSFEKEEDACAAYIKAKEEYHKINLN